MSYLQRNSGRTQVERTLALLVESGLLYCALWVCSYPSGNYSRRSQLLVLKVLVAIYVWSDAPGFRVGFYYVMSGCLVPLIVGAQYRDFLHASASR